MVHQDPGKCPIYLNELIFIFPFRRIIITFFFFIDVDVLFPSYLTILLINVCHV